MSLANILPFIQENRSITNHNYVNIPINDVQDVETILTFLSNFERNIEYKTNSIAWLVVRVQLPDRISRHFSTLFKSYTQLNQLCKTIKHEMLKWHILVTLQIRTHSKLINNTTSDESDIINSIMNGQKHT